MKKKDLSQLLTKTVAELGEILKKKRKEMVEGRLKFKKGELKDVHLAQKIRKDIAQILTIIKIKKLEGQPQ